MAFTYNPFTGNFDYYLEDLTGAEVVALLEALAGDARLSHTKLSDVGANDHHAQGHNAASHSDIASSGADVDDAVSKKHVKYTNAEARAATESNFNHALLLGGM